MASGSLNKVMLIGRLTSDPDMKYTPTGTQITKFSVAVNREFSKKGDEAQTGKQTADFINIVVWSKLAEICKNYIIKGSLVFIEGRLQIRSYDAKDGTKRWATDVVANNVQFLDNKKASFSSPASQAPQADNSIPDEIPEYDETSGDTEVPF